MQSCHCGSGQPYETCCAPFILGNAKAPTAEALMRSRYSAYVVGAIDYLGETLHPAHRRDWDREATRRWAEDAEWHGLEILSAEAGQADDSEGVVEFAANYAEKGEPRRHHELSRFAQVSGRWYYVDGDVPKPKTQRHEGPKVGRNDPCPCGSGKKYKKCCGA
jgi:SEC-C motif-containing protein